LLKEEVKDNGKAMVTEMQEIKHYYQEGVAARKGIES